MIERRLGTKALLMTEDQIIGFDYLWAGRDVDFRFSQNTIITNDEWVANLSKVGEMVTIKARINKESIWGNMFKSRRIRELEDKIALLERQKIRHDQELSDCRKHHTELMWTVKQLEKEIASLKDLVEINKLTSKQSEYRYSYENTENDRMKAESEGFILRGVLKDGRYIWVKQEGKDVQKN